MTEYEKRQEQRIKDLERIVLALSEQIKDLKEINKRPL